MGDEKVRSNGSKPIDLVPNPPGPGYSGTGIREHVAKVKANFGKSQEEIWKAVSDMEKWSDWNPFVKSMKQRDDGVWVMNTKMGEMPNNVIESIAPERLVTEIVDDKLPFGGR